MPKVQSTWGFHHRQKRFAFEEYTNTTQEVSFSAVKYVPSIVDDGTGRLLSSPYMAFWNHAPGDIGASVPSS